MKSTSRPTQDVMRFAIPAGTAGHGAGACADVETYDKGTTASSAGVRSAAVRPNALDVPGVRRWSPPV